MANIMTNVSINLMSCRVPMAFVSIVASLFLSLCKHERCGLRYVFSISGSYPTRPTPIGYPSIPRRYGTGAPLGSVRLSQRRNADLTVSNSLPWNCKESSRFTIALDSRSIEARHWAITSPESLCRAAPISVFSAAANRV